MLEVFDLLLKFLNFFIPASGIMCYEGVLYFPLLACLLILGVYNIMGPRSMEMAKTCYLLSLSTLAVYVGFEFAFFFFVKLQDSVMIVIETKSLITLPATTVHKNKTQRSSAPGVGVIWLVREQESFVVSPKADPIRLQAPHLVPHN